MRLSTKLPSLLLLIVIVPLLLVGYLAFRNGRQALGAATFHHLMAMAELKEDGLNRWLDDGAGSLRELARRPLIRQYATTLRGGPADGADYEAAAIALVDNHFKPTLSEGETFLELSLLSAGDGRVLATTNPSLAGANLSEASIFSAGYGSTSMEITGNVADARGLAAYVATPVTGGEGTIVAVLLGRLSLERIGEIMSHGGGEATSQESYLVNEAAQLVTRPRLGGEVVLDGRIQSAGVGACLQGNSGTEFYEDYRGVPVLGAYRWLAQRKLCLLTEMDEAEAVAPIVDLRNRIVQVGAVLLILAALIGIAFSRSLTRPLHHLVRGTERIGAGNLNYQIPVRGQDEIAQVAQAFNQMAGELRDSLGENIHGRRLLLALNDAGQAVQRAQTPAEVFSAVGREVDRLGFNVSVLLGEGDERLRLGYLGYDAAMIRLAEKLTGLSAADYSFAFSPGGYIEHVLRSGETLYFESVTDFIVETLPHSIHGLAQRIASLLGMRQGIVAPLAVDGERLGVLMVTGKALTEADVSAVSVFANQTAIALKNARLYEALRQYQADLERRVAARTAELQESEARFRALFEAVPVPMMVTRADDGTILEANKHVAAVTGVPNSEMIGSNAADLYLDQGERPGRIAEILDHGHVRAQELPIVRPDGEVRTLLVSTSVIDYEGEQALVTGFQDVTRRKKMEEALRHSEERFRALVQNANDVIAIIDADGRIRYESLSVERVLGYGPEERIGQNVLALAGPDEREAVEAAFNRLLSERAHTVSMEVQVRHKAGDWRTLELTAANLLDNPAVQGIVINYHDVTARNQAQAKLEAYVAELARSNEALQQFAYVASHDLQEPLRMVSSFLQLLQRRYEGQLDEAADEYIHFAVDGATRMKRLINDLLKYSRVATRGRPLVPIESQRLLDEVLEDLRLNIDESGARVICDPLPRIQGDETQVRQLFQNLVSNALKFRGEAPPAIDIAAERKNGMWHFRVQDNGIGIDPDQSERIFVIFQRLHHKEQYEGTGIGLAICKKIVERHGGSIWVESEPGEGATFCFTLPAVGDN